MIRPKFSCLTLSFLVIFSLIFSYASPVHAQTSSGTTLALILDSLQSLVSHLQSLFSALNSESQLADISGAGSGLVGYWTFDEGSLISGAGGIKDSSGNGNDGTFTQYTIGGTNPTGVSGKIGQGMQYNPSSLDTTKGVYVRAANPTAFDVGTGDFTVSMWYKTDGNTADPYEALFDKDYNSSGNGIWVLVRNHANGGFARATVGGASILGSKDITDNNWHLVTVVRNSGTVSLYIDASLDKTGTLAGNTNVTNEKLDLGAAITGPYLAHGIQDDVRFYNRALTVSEITGLYNYTGTASSGTVVSSPTSTPPQATNGSCGSASKTYTPTESFPQGAYCSSGIAIPSTPSDPAQDGTSPWTCSGSNGGTNATCFASRTIAITPPATNASGNIYIGQTDTGSATGADCSNTHSTTWFNTATNWGTTAGKIGPGTTVHLCGTLSSPLNIQGSGMAGSPITIFFEPNAKMSAPVWPIISGSTHRAAIYSNGYSYITVNGGSNGIIESTDNGTNLNNQLQQSGIYFTQVDYAQVENLLITNMYVRIEGTDDAHSSDAIDYVGGNHLKINNNTLNNCGNCVNYTYISARASTDVQMYGNTISKASIGINFGSGGSNATVDNVSIYNNEIFDTNNWDCISSNPDANCLLVKQSNHQNGMHIFAAQPGTTITNLRVYNNYLHGDIGVQSTAWIYMEGYLNGSLVYNNVFNGTGHLPSNGFIHFRGCPNCQAYNNTISSSLGGTALELSSWTGTETGIIFKNNIGFGVGQGIYCDDTKAYCLQALSLSNNNVFANPITNFLEWGFHSYALSDWQKLGYDLNSAIADPFFISPSTNNFHLQLNSPAINVGADLSQYFSADKDGTPRPQGQAWDIGAYEYCTTNCAPAPIVSLPPVIIPPPIITPPGVPPNTSPAYTPPPVVTPPPSNTPSSEGGSQSPQTSSLLPLVQSYTPQTLMNQQPVSPHTSSTTQSTSPYQFSRILHLGDRGDDVKKLQQFLNQNGFPISSSGIGSMGFETIYYGPKTVQAITQFQEHFRSDILTPSGFSHGTGIFGPATMRKINQLLTQNQQLSTPQPSQQTTIQSLQAQLQTLLSQLKTLQAMQGQIKK